MARTLFADVAGPGRGTCYRAGTSNPPLLPLAGSQRRPGRFHDSLADDSRFRVEAV